MNLLIASGNNRKSCMKAPGSERVKAFFIERPLKHADLVGFLISLIPNNKALGVLFCPL